MWLAKISCRRTKWNDLHSLKVKEIEKQCLQFSTLSNGVIKAEIKGSLDIETLRQKLKIAFTSLNIKEQKIEELCQYVLNAAEPMTAWNTILAELEALVLHTLGGSDPLPTTAVIDRCRFIATEKNRLAADLSSDRWLDLSVIELEFNPVFRYCTNKDTNEYIAFADASAGQQATALLTVLLNHWKSGCTTKNVSPVGSGVLAGGRCEVKPRSLMYNVLCLEVQHGHAG